jgi:hypothetical protein
MSLVVYVAGLLLIAAVAWAAASPLFTPPTVGNSTPAGSPQAERWRHQKDEALAAIKDAEFDFQLGKLSEHDYRELRARLEAQALEAMAALERRIDGDSR